MPQLGSRYYSGNSVAPHVTQLASCPAGSYSGEAISTSEKKGSPSLPVVTCCCLRVMQSSPGLGFSSGIICTSGKAKTGRRFLGTGFLQRLLVSVQVLVLWLPHHVKAELNTCGCWGPGHQASQPRTAQAAGLDSLCFLAFPKEIFLTTWWPN